MSKKQNDEIIDVSDKEKIITDEQALSEIENDLHLSMSDKKQRPLYVKTLNVFGEPFKKRYDKHYIEKKHHLVIDIFLVLIVVLLFVANGIFLNKKNKNYSFDFFSFGEEAIGDMFEIKGFVNQNGSSAVSPGDEIEYVIVFKNITGKEIENLNVEAEVLSSAVDFESFVSKGIWENQKMNWTRKEMESFSKIKPAQELEVDFSFQIKNRLTVGNPTVGIKLSFRGLVDGRSISFLEEVVPLKISSDLSLKAEYKYFTEEGEQLGFGAWPAREGEETTLRVFLNPINTLNAVKNVVVQATIPEGIEWGNHEIVNSGKLPTYDEAERVIRWEIPEVKTSKNILAHFELNFVPEKEEVILLQNILITGDDVFSGQKIERYFTDLVIE
jgi:hypothetical protein